MRLGIVSLNQRVFIAIDTITVAASFMVAFLLRFDFVFPPEYADEVLRWVIPIIGIKLVTFAAFNFYKGMFRYTSLWDISNIVKGNILSTLFIIILFGFIHGFTGFPRSIFLLDLLTSTAATALSRIAVRLYYTNYALSTDYNSYDYQDPFQKKKRLILIGAGSAGEKIVREIHLTRAIGFEVVGFVDDNKKKHGATLHGVKVLGSVSDLKTLSVPYDQLLITAPSAVGEKMRRIVDICKATGKPYKTVPDLSEIVNDDVSIKMMRDVSYADLLKREEVILDTGLIKNFIRGKRVLVTGAGGSIGSELVRQCAQYDPAMLILLDNSEYNLFSVQQELLVSEKKRLSATF